jgi:hypothetical protein
LNETVHTATFFTREANPNVLRDSLTAEGDGFKVHMTEIRASPESDGWSIRVSFEFRKGTWSLFSIMSTFRSKHPSSVASPFSLGRIFCQRADHSAKSQQAITDMSKLQYTKTNFSPGIDIFAFLCTFFVGGGSL